MTCHEAEPLLNPYLDGELDLVTAVRVEEHIAGCGGCGQEYRDLQELRRQIVEADLSFPPTPGLIRRVAAARRRQTAKSEPWWRRPGALAAVAAAALLLVLVPMRLLRTGAAPDRELLDSHLRSLMASHLVDVPSSDHHTVKPWFQGRLSFSPDVPDLSNQGFVLVGGRLEVVRRAPAAAIVYKRRDHVINLFVAPAGVADSPPRAQSSEGYNLVAWVNGGLSYWAVSDLNARELMQFAQLAIGR
jgi:anti-sigma factor RsiW